MYFYRQHAIVTGGSSGIGKATAQLLAREGAHISLIARDRSKLEAAKAEISAVIADPQQQVITISADVADPLQAEEAIKEAIAQNGAPNLLITSAGMAHPGYFQEIPIEVFERTMAINYFGSLYCIRAALPLMEQKREGHIVLVSSGAGLIGIYGYSSYCPSKFAVRGLAESLRGELKFLGINVSIVYPPDTDTPQLLEENKIKPKETKAIANTAKTWSAEEVASEIIRGIKQKSFAIAPGVEMKALGWLHSLLAPAINWYCDRIVLGSRNDE